MKHRISRVENPRKLTPPVQRRTPTPHKTPPIDPEPPFELAVSNLRSKLQSLEEKYSYFMRHYATQLHEHKSKRTVSSEMEGPERVGNRGDDETPGKDVGEVSFAGVGKVGKEPGEEAADVLSLVEETHQRVLRVLAGQKSRTDTEELISRVNDEFSRLLIQLPDSLQKFHTRAHPGPTKEWVRKLLRLEEEKRSLEAKHKDYIETLTQRMMSRIDEYQREIARLKRENALLSTADSSLKLSLPQSTTKQSPMSSPPKSQVVTRSVTPDLERSIPNRDGRRTATPDRRQGSPIERSVSPAERKIQSLKSELEGCKQKLDSAGYEIDLLKAWKESYSKNPPDYASLVQHHYSESEYERKQLLSKALILRHELNSILISVQRFIRLSSTLAKNARDKEVLGQFETAKVSLEAEIREIQKNEGPGGRSEAGHGEEEMRKLVEELREERDRGNTFAEMLRQVQLQIEEMSGIDISPTLFLSQQNKQIRDLKEQVQNAKEETEGIKRENRLLQDKQQVERLTNQRVSEEMELLKRRSEEPFPVEDETRKQLRNFGLSLSQELERLGKSVSKRLQTREDQLFNFSQTFISRMEEFKSEWRDRLKTVKNRLHVAETLGVSLQASLAEKTRIYTLENEKLAAQLQMQRAALADLKQSHIDELRKLTESHNAQLAQSQSELKGLLKEIKAGETDNKALRLELEDTLKQLSLAETEAAKLLIASEKEESLQQRIEKKRLKLKSIKETSEAALANMNKELEDAQRRCEAMQRNKAETDKETLLLSKQVADTRQLLKKQEVQYRQDTEMARTQIAQLEREKKTLEDELNTAISRCSVEKETYVSEMESFQAAFDQVNTSKQHLQEALNQRSQEIDTLKTEAAASKSLIERLQHSNESLNSEYRHQTAQLTEQLKKASQDWERNNELLTRDNESLKSLLERKSADFAHVLTQNANLQGTVERLEAKVSDVTQTSVDAHQALSYCKQENIRLGEEKTELNTRLEQLISDLKKAEKNAEVASVLGALQTKVSTQNEEMHNLHETIDRLSLEKAELVLELDTKTLHLNDIISKRSNSIPTLNSVKRELFDLKEGLIHIAHQCKGTLTVLGKDGEDFVYQIKRVQDQGQFRVREETQMLEKRIQDLMETKAVLEENVVSLRRRLEENSEQFTAETEKTKSEILRERNEFESKLQEMKLLQTSNQAEKVKSQSEFRSLEEEIDKKDAECMRLKLRLESQQTEFNSIQDTFETEKRAFAATISKLKDAVIGTETALSDKSSELNRVQESFESLKKYTQEMKSANETLRKEAAESVGRVKREYEAMQGQMKESETELNTQCRKLETEAAGLRSELSIAENRLEVEIQEKTALERKCQSQVSFIENMHSQSNTAFLEAQERISEMTLDASHHREEILALKATVSEAKAACAVAKTESEKHISELFETMEQKIALEDTIRKLRDDLSNVQREVSQRTMQIEVQTQHETDMKNALAKLSSEKTVLEMRIQTAEEQFQSAQLQHKRQIEDFDQQRVKSVQEIEGKDEKIAAQLGKILLLEEEVRTCSQLIESMKAKHADMDSLLHSSEKESRVHKLQISALEAELTVSKQSQTELSLLISRQATDLQQAKATSEQLTSTVFAQTDQIAGLSQELETLKEHSLDLESEITDLTEALRRLNTQGTDQPFILTTNSDLDSVQLEGVQESKDGDTPLEVLVGLEPQYDLEEPELRSEPVPADSGRGSSESGLEQRLSTLLARYSPPQQDVLTTIQQLLDELDLMKRSKTGVVIPKLQLPMLQTSEAIQTSPSAALSQSLMIFDDGKNADRPVDESPEPLSKSVNLSSVPDQDTPKSRMFPELWRTRVSSELKQVKTEEIYSLHSRVRAMEKDLKEETNLREHLEMQIRLLKEEIAEKERQLKRAAMVESAGEKSPVNVEHLKDLVMKLMMLLPIL